MYHIRKFYNEEDILKLFEEEEEKEMEEEGGSAIEDVDIDSLSDEEKVSFAVDLLKSIENSDKKIQEKVEDALECLEDIEFDGEDEEEDED